MLAPDGPGLPGRHAVREPGRHRRRAGHAAAARPTRSTRTSTRAARRSPALAAEALDRGRRPARRAARRQHVLGLLHRRRRSRDYDGAAPQDTAALHRVLPRDARRRASTCRRPRSRRGSSPPPTTTARVETGSLDALPAAARAAAAATRGGRLSERRQTRSSTCCGTARCTTPSGVLYGRLPGYHLSELGRADGRAGRRARSATATSSTSVASPLERAQETARAARPRPTASTSPPTTRLIEATNIFEGKTFGVGDGVAAQARRPGGTCATRSSRRGASRTTQVVARMLAAVARRPRRGPRPRGGRRLPPAADLDDPAARREAVVPARPAQAPVHAVLADVVALRRRPAASGVATPSRPAT